MDPARSPDGAPDDLGHIFAPGRVSCLLGTEPPILSAPGHDGGRGNRRFEGRYGRLYTRVIQTPALRRAAFSMWGSADPLHRLEAFVSDAVAAARAASAAPVIVDVPSGSGTLLPLLADQGFAGTVVEVDLAMSMLRRATMLDAAGLHTVFLHADALDLPLRDAIADVVITINGLHVVSDPRRFLAEAARVLKPNGKLWLITPVTAAGVRSRMILAAARALAITPGRPPTLPELHQFLDEVGFRRLQSYGGTSITGLACARTGG